MTTHSKDLAGWLASQPEALAITLSTIAGACTRISESADGGTVRIIDEATVPTFAISPNRAVPISSSVRGRSSGTGTISLILPGRGVITTTRSASSTASGMLWVTNSTARPVSFHIRNNSRLSSSRVIASSAANGSSIKSRLVS